MFPSSTASSTTHHAPRRNSAPRKSRPRHSCHDCFKAKVKCDKERPGCTRCVTIGRDCGYVDYDQNGNVIGSPTTAACDAQPDAPVFPALGNDEFYPLGPAFASGQGWNLGTATMMTGDGMTAHSMSVMVSGIQAETDLSTSPLSIRLPWQQPLQPVQHAEFLDPRASMPPSTAEMPYPLDTGNDASLSNLSLAPNLDGPVMHHIGPTGQPVFASAAGDWPVQSNNICGCFSQCLGGLQQLEVVSTEGVALLDLNGILSLCLEALAACSALLSCGACQQSAEPQTTALLLATALNKISGLYLDACCNLAETSPATPMHASGALAVVGNGRSVMADMLAQHLAKLDQVCGMFASALGGLRDGGGVMDATTASLVERMKALRAMCDWA